MENPSTQSLVDFWGVITESKRIINAHSRHFLALSVLFILPLSFSLSVFPTLLHTFTSPTPNHIKSLLFLTLPHSKTPPFFHLLHPTTKTLTFSLLFASFTLFFTLLAISSVTSSVYHGFYGRPVKIISAMTSLFRSFLPLLGTFITAQIVLFGVLALVGGFCYVGVRLIEFFVGENGIQYDSTLFFAVCLIGVLCLGFVLAHMLVNWVLVGVVVVVESKWGLEPLVRSKGLVRGMKWVALCLIMYFGFFVGVLCWISMVAGVDSGGSGVGTMGGWNTWGFVLQIVATSAVLTMLLLHSIAATTVLYMYCKALHGELAGEIASEFAAEYVSFPFDDQKVPHVVCHVC